MPPLIEEVSVYVYAVGLAQVLRDEGPDGGEILRLEAMFVLDVAQLAGQLGDLSKIHLPSWCGSRGRDEDWMEGRGK